MPALNSLPQVRKVRRQASGAVDAPTVTTRPFEAIRPMGAWECPTKPRDASGLDLEAVHVGGMSFLEVRIIADREVFVVL
jgi:hypothetical protein